MSPKRILGLETSCDETAAAVVDSEGRIVSSVVASQIDTHGKYGGVVPELASREHLRAIVPVVRTALAEAQGWSNICAVAATAGPGLVGSLLVGLTFAKSVSTVRRIPLIGVNHLEGHIHAVLLEARAAGEEVQFPALALVASGGHTHLYGLSNPHDYSLIGKTRDDAAGEAFDKVAKLLGFGYPGGPILDALAPYGDPDVLPLSLVKMKGNQLDFSFSGIKTAMLRWSQAQDMVDELSARRGLRAVTAHPTVEEWLKVTPQTTLDAIAAFQKTVVEELVLRLAAAAEETGAQAAIVAGGVACNAGLRRAATARRIGCPVYFPTPSLSTDNAAMIAAAAWARYNRGEFSDLSLKAQAGMRLE